MDKEQLFGKRYARKWRAVRRSGERLRDWLNRAERKHSESVQAALYQISEATFACQGHDALFKRIHTIIGELLPATNFYVALYDEANEEVAFPYFVDEIDPSPVIRKLGLGLTDYVIRTGEPLLLSDENRDHLVEEGKIRIRGTPPVAWLGVPLVTSRGRIGVLAVESYTESVRYTEQHLALLQFVSNQVAMAVERTRDAEELTRVHEALKEQSLTDPLTGLRNRRFLMACMPEDVAQVQRVQRDVIADRTERLKLNVDIILVMADLDFFKRVNDELGHRAGDLVLQQMGDILRACSRATDTAVRWGGEEFLLVARNSSRVDAPILPERIRKAVEAHPFDVGRDQPIRCTCSLGFCIFPLSLLEVEAFTWEQCLELADQCLYAAKHSGRNAWVGIYPGADRIPRASNGKPLLDAKLFPSISSLSHPVKWEDT